MLGIAFILDTARSYLIKKQRALHEKNQTKMGGSLFMNRRILRDDRNSNITVGLAHGEHSTWYQRFPYKGLIASIVGIAAALFVALYGELLIRFPWDWYGSVAPVPATVALGTLLVLLLGVNPLLGWIGKRIRRNLALESADFVVVYIVTAITQWMAHIGFFTDILIRSSGIALVANATVQEYFGSLSEWLVLKDLKTLLNFHLGRGAVVPWNIWIPIFVTWGFFVAVWIFLLQCVSVLIRRSWRSHEHLVYPTVKPILMLTEDAGEKLPPLWKNRLLWIGLLAAAIYRGIPVIHVYFPVVPDIPTTWVGMLLHPIGTAVFGGAWSQMNLGLPLFPWTLACAWLVVTGRVLFTGWFMHFVLMGYVSVIERYGLGGIYGGFPYRTEQSGYIVVFIGIYYVWLMRNSLRDAWLITIGRLEDDEGESQALTTRTAVLGAMVAFMFLILFAWFFFSLAPWVSVVFIFCMVMIQIGFARFRAESGWGYHLPLMNYHDAVTHFGYLNLVSVFGGKVFGKTNILGLGFLDIIDQVAVPNVGATLEALHLAEGSGISQRHMFKIIWIAIIAASVLAVAIGLPAIYSAGGTRAMPNLTAFTTYNGGQDFWGSVADNIIKPYEKIGPNWFKIGFLTVPIFLIVLCMYLNTYHIWWPLHPLGVGIGLGHWNWRFTSPFFLAWFLKAITFRYGGMALWKKLNPLFVGLLAGDVIVLVIRSIIGVFAS
jgi:hypothetical protein